MNKLSSAWIEGIGKAGAVSLKAEESGPRWQGLPWPTAPADRVAPRRSGRWHPVRGGDGAETAAEVIRTSSRGVCERHAMGHGEGSLPRSLPLRAEFERFQGRGRNVSAPADLLQSWGHSDRLARRPKNVVQYCSFWVDSFRFPRLSVSGTTLNNMQTYRASLIRATGWCVIFRHPLLDAPGCLKKRVRRGLGAGGRTRSQRPR